ncbi:MAG: DUF3658 domain-containing protein [Oscillospiraceae bacterium]
MLQVVTGDSEKGAIYSALNFSTSQMAAVGFIGLDGEEIAEEEKAELLKEAIEQHKKRNMRGAALTGNREDLIGIPHVLDLGPINTPLLGDARKNYTLQMFTANPWQDMPQIEEDANLYWQGCVNDCDRLLQRATLGEPVRIWYSNAAYSLCGLYAALHLLKSCACPITVVELPRLSRLNDTDAMPQHWGEVFAGDWAAYLPLETEITPRQKADFVTHWERLMQQNAPLRANINGVLHSVPANFYDDFIRQEIPSSSTKIAQIIGKTLGNHQLCISDWWVSRRLQSMIDTNELQVIQQGTGFYDWTVAPA